MKNENVIDFFSRQSFTDIATEDIEYNDEMTNKHGVYLGCLKKQDTKNMRDLVVELEFKRRQIDQLTAEWELLHNHHQDLVQNCLDFLKVSKSKNINIDKDTIMVGEDGHTWVIYDYHNLF